MAKINVQFHATIEDIYDCIIDMIGKEYIVKGIIIFPDFEIHEIKKNIDIEELKRYDNFCVSKYEIANVNSFREFSMNRFNTIGIDIGTKKTSKTSMTEMIMWIGS